MFLFSDQQSIEKERDKMFSLAILDTHHDLVFEYNSQILFKQDLLEGEKISKETLIQKYTPLLLTNRVLEAEKNLEVKKITFGLKHMMFEKLNGFDLITCGKKSVNKLRCFLLTVKKCIGQLVADDLEWLRSSYAKQIHLSKILSSWEHMVNENPFRLVSLTHSLKVNFDVDARIEMSLSASLTRIPAELPALASVIIKGKFFKLVTNRSWKDDEIERSSIFLHVYDVTRRSSNGVLTRLFLKSNGIFTLHYAYVHKIFNNITFFVVVQSRDAKGLHALQRLNNYLSSSTENPSHPENAIKKFRKEFSGFDSRDFRPLVNELRNVENSIKRDDPLKTVSIWRCRDTASLLYKKLTSDSQRHDLMNNFALMSSYVQGKFHFYWDWLVEEEENVPQEVEQIVTLYGSDVVLWFLEEQDKQKSRMVEKYVSKLLSHDEVTEILAAVATSDAEILPSSSERIELSTECFRILIMKMKSNRPNGSTDCMKQMKLCVAVKLLEETLSD